MDEKLKELEEELQQTRSALRWQRTRCHHLVSALTIKLEQREAEVKSLSNLRDTQFNQILCALLNLEARLRREQRSIRAQLGSRDAIIREQQLEISRLKKLIEPQQRPASPPESLQSFQSSSNDYENHIVKPDLISSLGIWNNSQKNSKKFPPAQEKQNEFVLGPFSNNNNSLTPSLSTDISESTTSTVIQVITSSQANKPEPESISDFESSINTITDSISSLDNNFSKDRASSCTVINNNYDKDNENNEALQNSFIINNDEYCDNSITKYDFDQLRPPSVDISIPESADSFTVIHDMSRIPETITPPEEFSEKEMKHLPPSALLHEMQVQSKSGKNEYHDNPVLECVNQILLRDQEEFLEEQRALRMKEVDRNKTEVHNLNHSRSREDLTIYNQSPLKERISPNKKLSHNFQDKPCLVTSKQLKLVGNVNFEDSINGNELFNHNNEQKLKKCNSNPKLSPQSKNSIPPALPPKPLRLLNMKSINDFKQDNATKIKQPITTHLSLNQQNFELNIRPNLEIIGKSSPALPEPTSDSELYVISNSALDDEILQQIQGRNIKNCVELKKVLNSDQKKANELTTHAAIHFPAGKKKESHSSNQDKLSCSNSLSNSAEKRKTSIPSKSPVKNSVPQVIKVASPVSSLLATVESITNEQNDTGLSKSVLQIVQRFEHLGNVEKQPITNAEEDGNNTLRKNFEEFRLDECDMDALCTTTDEDGRAEADGAENRLNVNINATTPAATVMPAETGVSYENFLEATGLSQKSIMTPSRIFSNHKHVLKPKDVKHRSRVKAAATVSNSTVRYWTEPYL